MQVTIHGKQFPLHLEQENGRTNERTRHRQLDLSHLRETICDEVTDRHSMISSTLDGDCNKAIEQMGHEQSNMSAYNNFRREPFWIHDGHFLAICNKYGTFKDFQRK